MSAKLTPVYRDLQTLYELGRIGDCTDDQLLEQFRSREGYAAEVAFSTLIHRHGPMVLRVCRSVLSDEHDAQDAFQATFLVLVNGASAVRDRSSVASWLYGVALRVSSRAKVGVAKRRAHERRAASMIKESRHDGSNGTLADRSLLHEEIRRLPEKYRSIILLCYFEGLTQEQAAQHLGWPPGTARGRLFRARELLRDRLTRRGMSVPAGAVLAGLLTRDAASAPASLVESTARAAVLTGAGKTAAGAAVSDAVASLVRGTPQAASHLPLKLTAALLGVGLVAAAVWGATDAIGRSVPPPLPRASAAEVKTPSPNPAMAPDPTGQDQAQPKTPLTKAVPKSTPKVEPTGPHRDPTAIARPLANIEIDGDLADWPSDLERHPILKQFHTAPMGYGGLKGADLTTSPDLNAWFAAGYDPDAQLVYVAVVVRDDKVVVGHTSHADTDAVEIYVDGLLANRRVRSWADDMHLEDLPVQQYIGIPGSGRIYGTTAGTNPILIAGDLRKTKTRMKYRRQGDVTTYEWAIQPFDHYPDTPSVLEPGKRIGFDVAVVDKDVPARSPGGLSEPEPDRSAWIYWGPTWAGIKVLDAGNLGELLLGDSP